MYVAPVASTEVVVTLRASARATVRRTDGRSIDRVEYYSRQSIKIRLHTAGAIDGVNLNTTIAVKSPASSLTGAISFHPPLASMS
jgi:hypothetical protein